MTSVALVCASGASPLWPSTVPCSAPGCQLRKGCSIRGVLGRASKLCRLRDSPSKDLREPSRLVLYLLCHNYFVKCALARGRLLYHMATKMHLFWHLVDMARWQNPRWAACFEFEDFMGKMKKSAQAAMAGSSLALIGSKVMEYCLLSLHLKISQ